MLNQIDRFNPTIDVVDWFLALGVSEAHVREWLENKILSSTSITFMKRV
jgi:phosphoketolase